MYLEDSAPIARSHAQTRLSPPPRRRSVDRGDHRRVEPAQRVDPRVELGGQFTDPGFDLVEPLEVGEVAADAEALSGARKDHGADVVALEQGLGPAAQI